MTSQPPPTEQTMSGWKPPKPRGHCPVCERPYKLGSKSGLIPKHWARTADGTAAPGLPDCDGSGKPPKEAS